MRAIIYNNFGGPEVLSLDHIESPIPSDTEILIDVTFAGVNPIDWKIREGYFDGMLDFNFPLVPGWDVSGIVSQVGAKVKSFKLGDKVYGMTVSNPIGTGTYAEQTLISEDCCSKIPETITMAEAAGIPLASIAANDALFRLGKLTEGQSILIHQGAGGVGTFAVQLASQSNAKVYTTCSTPNIETVMTFGPNRVIDYTREDFMDVIKTSEPGGLDVVLDGVGGETFLKSHGLIKRGGIMVTMGDPPNESLAKKNEINSVFLDSTPNGTWLSELALKIDNNKFILPKTHSMKLEQASEAQTISKEGHVVGKIVLEI